MAKLMKVKAKKTEKQTPSKAEKTATSETVWRNRERVLVFCSRGASFRDRHLMKDMRSLMPHARDESKMDKKQDLRTINEIADMKNCTKCIYFENRKRSDLYMWLSNIPNGPSARFLVHNVHTMAELRLTGNCLRGARPLLSFDAQFDQLPHMKLIKELLIQTFGTPRRHPRSQPFIDHVLTFSVTDDGRIWFRNYQIIDETTQQMEEIGPRMVLELIKVFESSFGGATLYENEKYVSPNQRRSILSMRHVNKYANKQDSIAAAKETKANMGETFTSDPYDAVFDTKNEAVQSVSNGEANGKKKKKSKKRRNTGKTEGSDNVKRARAQKEADQNEDEESD